MAFTISINDEAAFEIVVPPDVITDTGSTTYEFTARGFSEATPND